MKINRRGATREIIIIGQIVVKIPKLMGWKSFLCGLLSNLHERIWSKSNHFKHLCPIYFSDPLGFIVIMPKCKILTDDEYNIKKKNIPTISIVEGKCDSWGYYKERLVAVDYGNWYGI